MLAKFEPVIGFLQFDDLAPAWIECSVGQAVLVGQKRFFLRRVKTFVGFLVKMSGGVKFCEDGLNEFFVARFGRTDEIVVGESEFFGKCLPIGSQFVAIRLRTFSLRQRGLLHLLSVLVESGEEKNFLPEA